MDEAAGSIAGEQRYTLLREVARGGMATVYLATDSRHGRQVALKVMEESLVGPLGADRFLREIEIVARLTHPHIVPLYDSGELQLESSGSTPRPFYVMPFIAGESLRQRLSRTGPFPLDAVVRIVREVASALDYAHREGVIHRDIKPENIMLAEGHALVADFGIARAVAEASGTLSGVAGLTQVGTIVGTPAYMAPEQGSGDAVDARTDQYSLACVAFELLTGAPPFTAPNAMGLLAQHMTAAPPSLSGFIDVPAHVEAALHRALAKVPGQRFASAAELADAMLPARSGSWTPAPRALSRPTLSQAGERRHATVVATAIADYETLVERLAPNELDCLVATVRRLATEVAAAHGGTLNHFEPDDAMLLFGIPTSHEDDAVQAVRAVLQLHEQVRAAAEADPAWNEAGVGMRSALHTGVVVAQELTGGDRAYRITGVARDHAIRLAALAEVNTVVASADSHRLVAPFVRAVPGPPAAIGSGTPMPTFRIVAESDVYTRLEAAERAGLTPFAGRGKELRTLEEQLGALRDGEGGVVAIIGEAGSGKSRLLHELRRRLRLGTSSLVVGRCDAHGTTTPYLPFVQVARDILGIAGEGGASMSDGDVASRVVAIEPSLDEHLPLYFLFLGNASARYPIPRHLQGEQLQAAMRQALMDLIARFAIERPCVLLLEDWHWADEASRAALDALMSATAESRLLVIVTSRPEGGVDLSAHDGGTVLNLGPLSVDASAEIVRGVFAAERVSSTLARRLHERTGGNPFFLEESCQSLREEGAVVVRDGEAVALNESGRLQLPASVQAVIRSRLDRLAPEAREILRVASVIGREFPRPVLAELADPSLDLDEGLQTLQGSGLIQRVGVVPQLSYRFKHVLTREVAYDTLLEHQRRTLHAAVVPIIERLYPGQADEFLERLAHHSAGAAAWLAAAAYGVRSAERSGALSQFADALAMLDRAEGWVVRASDGDSRVQLLVDVLLRQERLCESLGLRSRQVSIVERLIALLAPRGKSAKLAEAYLRQGDLYTLLRRFDEADGALAQAYEMSVTCVDRKGERNALRSLGLLRTHEDRLDEAVDATRAALAMDLELGETTAAAGAMISLGNIYRNLGRFDEALAVLEEARRCVTVEDDPAKWVMATTLIGRTYRETGDVDRALPYLEHALAVAVEHQIPFVVGFVMPGIAHIQLAQDRTEEALATYRQLADISRRDRHAEGLAQALRGLGEVLVGLERFAEATPPLREAAALFEQLEDRDAKCAVEQRLAAAYEHVGEGELARQTWTQVRLHHQATANVAGESASLEALGRCARTEGDRPEAIANYRHAIAAADSLGDVRRLASLHNTLGLLHWESGQIPEALVSYTAALTRSRQGGDLVHEGLLLNTVAATLLRLGRTEEARASLEAAIGVNRETGERRLEAHSHATLGDVLLAAGQPSEARAAYEQSLALRPGFGDRRGEGWMHERIARSWQAENRPAEAAASAADATIIAVETADGVLLDAITRILANSNH
jgi:tetratricopeptide (TPR) repeat protein/class 3 adenylate cyclase